MFLAPLILAAAVSSRAQNADRLKDTDQLFLDMSKVNLGTITSEDDKKKYIYTIQLEKARITRRTLKNVYENAFDLYKAGEYEGARELTTKILAIDPGYEDASILQRATIELNGSKKPHFSERKLVEDKFEEGMALYRQGRLVEAGEHWEEAVKLSPGNLKARYWLKKARAEMADEHFRRGQKAYRQHRLKDTLVEAEAREMDSNEKLQTALNLYSQGQTQESLQMLDQVLEAGPGNAKAQKLMAEIRSEMASQHVSQGRSLYESRKYNEAMAEWKKAVTYGYDAKAADQLVARAKEQMRREDAARVAASKAAAVRKEADAAKAAEDAKAAEIAKKKADDDAAAAVAAKKAAEATNGAAGASGASGSAGSQGGAPKLASSEDSRKSSGQHYLSGMIFYQKGDLEKAKDEWTLSRQLDPGNSDAQAGLDRIEKMYNTGQ